MEQRVDDRILFDAILALKLQVIQLEQRLRELEPKEDKKEYTCIRCYRKCTDENYMDEHPNAKRVYCNSCIDFLTKRRND